MTLLLAAWMTASSALACETASMPPSMILDPESTDTEPPSGGELLDYYVGPAENAGCGDCPDAVKLWISFDPPDDNETPPENVGYFATVKSGELPPGITLPEEPFVGPTATFVWEVDKTKFADGFKFEIEVRSIDQAGNISNEYTIISVDQPEIPAFLLGCNSLGGGGVAGWMALASLVWIRRRRS